MILFMIDLIKNMKKVLIIWLWKQWKRHINYFKNNNCEVFWVCKTNKTKNNIMDKFFIEVVLDIKLFLVKYSFDIVIFALPEEIQWDIILKYINDLEYVNKIVVEMPISNNNKKIELIKQYKNIYFFIEEYYSLFWKFCRKIDTKYIDWINIELFIHIDDKDSIKNNIIHIKNNFIWTNLLDKIRINNIFLKNSDFENDQLDYWKKRLCYNIKFKYNNMNIIYNFWYTSVDFKIWNKVFVDNWNFDNNLSKILNYNNELKDIYKN